MAILSDFEISDEEKELIVQGLIEYTFKFMEDCVNRETSTERAKRFSNPHHQSKTAIAENTINYNLLTKQQQLPARPRDFRLKLANEEKKIGMAEMSDILSSSSSSPVSFAGNLLDKQDGKYPYRRGRPNSNLAKERRGRPTYYTESDIQRIFDSIINDKKLLQKIDDNVTSHEIFPKFLNYSFNTMLKEIKIDETAFRNSYKPVLINKIHYLEKNNLSATEWILPKDLDKNKIKELSRKYTQRYTTKLNREQLNILYMAGFFRYCESLRSQQN